MKGRCIHREANPLCFHFRKASDVQKINSHLKIEQTVVYLPPFFFFIKVLIISDGLCLTRGWFVRLQFKTHAWKLQVFLSCFPKWPVCYYVECILLLETQIKKKSNNSMKSVFSCLTPFRHLEKDWGTAISIPYLVTKRNVFFPASGRYLHVCFSTAASTAMFPNCVIFVKWFLLSNLHFCPLKYPW